MSTLTRMRDHDANEEIHYLREGRRVCIGWSWLWLEWQFGISVYLDPHDRPGVWLHVGPLVIGGFIETGGTR